MPAQRARWLFVPDTEQTAPAFAVPLQGDQTMLRRLLFTIGIGYLMRRFTGGRGRMRY
jgi:hypothetical protein